MTDAMVAQLRAEADEFIRWAAAEGNSGAMRHMAQFLRDVADEIESLRARVAELEARSLDAAAAQLAAITARVAELEARGSYVREIVR